MKITLEFPDDADAIEFVESVRDHHGVIIRVEHIADHVTELIVHTATISHIER